MTTSTPSSSSLSSKTSARSFMARTGLLVSVVCAAALGGGLATLVLVNNSNTSRSSPYDSGDHQQRTEAAALQHRLAVVETQLAEVTATVAMLTTRTPGIDTDSSSNRRLGAFRSSAERYRDYLKSTVPAMLGTSVDDEDDMEATPPPDNDLVCTPLRAWVLSMIFRYSVEDQRAYVVDSNRTIFEENAVGGTEKHTMYKPTAKNILLCDGEIVCPTPTEELGIFGGNWVYPAAGPTIGDVYSSWGDFMVLLDPVMINTGNGPLTQYRSSFAYTEYMYQNGDDDSADGSSAKLRVPEFPITGGTGRFGSASGSVKILGYTFIRNEATGNDEEYYEFQFNVCVPPPKNTNPAPLGPPKKSGKTSKPSF